MLNAQEVNTILDGLLTTLETRSPSLQPLSVGVPEPVKSHGIYGSVVLAALFTGTLEGKLTLALDWTNALGIAGDATQKSFDSFDSEAQGALEAVFLEATQTITSHFANGGVEVKVRILPTLTDSDALLSEEGGGKPIKLPLTGNTGTLSLFLAFA